MNKRFEKRIYGGGISLLLIAGYLLCFGMKINISLAAVVLWAVLIGAVFGGCFDFVRKLPKERFLKIISEIIFYAAVLLYLSFTFFKTFSYDEAYTVGMIHHSFKEIVEITANDVHSPAYYFMLKLFCMLPGVSELWGSRLFSVIFSILFLATGRVFCRKHYDREIEIYWLLTAGFMPAMIIQAGSPRMYTAGIFFVSAAAMLALSLYEKETAGKWLLFAAASIFSVYLHTFFMLETLVLYIIFFIVLVWHKKYKSLIGFFMSGAAVIIAYVPWLIVLWGQMKRWAGWEAGWSNTIEPTTFFVIDKYFAEWFSSLENPQPLAVLFGVSLIIYSSYYLADFITEKKDYKLLAGPAAAVAVFAAAMIISIRVVPCFLGRYLFPVFGMIWLGVSVGLRQIRDMHRKAAIILTILLCSFFAVKDVIRLQDAAGLEQYQEYMEQNLGEEDVIMYDNYFLAMMSIFYPERNDIIYGSKPPCLPFGEMEIFQEWEQLDGTETIWYLSFSDNVSEKLEEYYEYEDILSFEYSYYQITLQKLSRKHSS